MGTQDIVAAIAKKNGVDEVIVVSTSKLELKEWVAERAKWLQNPAKQPLCVDRARLILREFGECALIIGKEAATFTVALHAIEDELHKKGFYRAWTILNEPLGKTTEPSMEWFSIDIVATLRRYKKNLASPMPSEYPPWGIILLQ